jgi:hypothetical protein
MLFHGSGCTSRTREELHALRSDRKTHRIDDQGTSEDFRTPRGTMCNGTVRIKTTPIFIRMLHGNINKNRTVRPNTILKRLKKLKTTCNAEAVFLIFFID